MINASQGKLYLNGNHSVYGVNIADNTRLHVKQLVNHHHVTLNSLTSALTVTEQYTQHYDSHLQMSFSHNQASTASAF